MFQQLSSLLFGGSKEACAGPEEVRPRVVEADEDGWLLVSLSDGKTNEAIAEDEVLAEHADRSVYALNLEESVATLVTMVSSVRLPEMAPPGGWMGTPVRTTRAVASRTGPLIKVTQASRLQRAQARANSGNLSRACLRRQNLTHKPAPRRSANTHPGVLQQPCPRSSSH